MPIDLTAYRSLAAEAGQHRATLVAVSKTKPVSDILALYESGHRDFGENYVNELLEKHKQLPTDIRWHFIGHLQSNKAKTLVPFVHLIHGVDSQKLLNEIQKQAAKLDRKVDCLLQVHIAEEETKFGLSVEEAKQLLHDAAQNHLTHVAIKGLMGMATLTENEIKIRQEFRSLHGFFNEIRPQQTADWNILSMGMTSDYKIALEEGSTMVRIGSAIFGERRL